MPDDDTSTRECRQAIVLGTDFLAASGRDPIAYKLIGVENRLSGEGAAGPHAWRLTFKPRRLLPAWEGAEVGVGGEVYVEVDLATGTTRLGGHGR